MQGIGQDLPSTDQAAHLCLLQAQALVLHPGVCISLCACLHMYFGMSLCTCVQVPMHL